MHRQVAKKNGCFWWIFCYLLWLQYPAICFDLNISCYIVCLLVPNLSNGFRRGRSKCMLYFLCPMPKICVREILFFWSLRFTWQTEAVLSLYEFFFVFFHGIWCFFYLCKVLDSVRTFCWCKMVQLGCSIDEDEKRNILIHDVIVNCATFRVFFALFMGLKGEPKGAKEVIFWPCVGLLLLNKLWGEFFCKQTPLTLSNGKITTRNSSCIPRYDSSLAILCPLGQRQEKLGHGHSLKAPLEAERQRARFSHITPRLFFLSGTRSEGNAALLLWQV